MPATSQGGRARRAPEVRYRKLRHSDQDYGRRVAEELTHHTFTTDC